MSRKRLLQQIDHLKQECAICPQVSIYKGNKKDQLASKVCSKCPIGLGMREIGEALSSTRRKWSKEEVNYIVNHIDVLGVRDGAMKAAKKLGVTPLMVEVKYYEVKEKEQPTGTAV